MNGIWKYDSFLPEIAEASRLSLGEGGTPLVRSRRIGPQLGIDRLYFKLETGNPTGSYKDRFAASAISDLLSRGVGFCVATSSGNTGAALAAYCAAASIRCFIATVDGAPEGKVRQMQAYGAETLMIRDFGKRASVTDDVFSSFDAIARRHGTSVQISAYRYCPVGMAGVETIAHEIAESLQPEGAHVFSPAGGGGLTLAVAKGFLVRAGRNGTGGGVPRVHCVQPEGNNTIAGPLRDGSLRAREVTDSTTMISGLQVPSVIDGDEVITGCRKTGGTGYVVSDALIYDCQKELAHKEGIFCEPAGAVALAGLIAALESDEVDRAAPAVCLVTGHGFKDEASARRISGDGLSRTFATAAETVAFIESQL